MFMKHFVVSQIVLHYIITSFSVCPEKFCIFLIFKNVNIKFDIFSCFYRFAVLHNT